MECCSNLHDSVFVLGLSVPIFVQKVSFLLRGFVSWCKMNSSHNVIQSHKCSSTICRVHVVSLDIYIRHGIYMTLISFEYESTASDNSCWDNVIYMTHTSLQLWLMSGHKGPNYHRKSTNNYVTHPGNLQSTKSHIMAVPS